MRILKRILYWCRYGSRLYRNNKELDYKLNKFLDSIERFNLKPAKVKKCDHWMHVKFSKTMSVRWWLANNPYGYASNITLNGMRYSNIRVHSDTVRRLKLLEKKWNT